MYTHQHRDSGVLTEAPKCSSAKPTGEAPSSLPQSIRRSLREVARELRDTTPQWKHYYVLCGASLLFLGIFVTQELARPERRRLNIIRDDSAVEEHWNKLRTTCQKHGGEEQLLDEKSGLKDVNPGFEGCIMNVMGTLPVLAALTPFAMFALAPDFLVFSMIVAFGFALTLLFGFHAKAAGERYFGLASFSTALATAGLACIAYNEIAQGNNQYGEMVHWEYFHIGAELCILLGGIALVCSLSYVACKLDTSRLLTAFTAIAAIGGITCAVLPQFQASFKIFDDADFHPGVNNAVLLGCMGIFIITMSCIFVKSEFRGRNIQTIGAVVAIAGGATVTVATGLSAYSNLAVHDIFIVGGFCIGIGLSIFLVTFFEWCKKGDEDL